MPQNLCLRVPLQCHKTPLWLNSLPHFPSMTWSPFTLPEALLLLIIHLLDLGLNSKAILAPLSFPPPAAAHTEKKDKAAGGSGFSSQCNMNGPPAAPVSAHEIGAGGSHKHVPYPPAGWFGPPGPGPQFQGYPGPPFFPPYNGWGTFSNMDHARQGGAAAPQPGCYGRSPYDLPGFYFGEQPFGFPNGYPSANMSNMPGTSDGGCAAQDTASGGNAK